MLPSVLEFLLLLSLVFFLVVLLGFNVTVLDEDGLRHVEEDYYFLRWIEISSEARVKILGIDLRFDATESSEFFLVSCTDPDVFSVELTKLIVESFLLLNCPWRIQTHVEHRDLKTVSFGTRVFFVNNTDVKPSFFEVKLSEVAVHVDFLWVKGMSLMHLLIVRTLLVPRNTMIFTIWVRRAIFTSSIRHWNSLISLCLHF